MIRSLFALLVTLFLVACSQDSITKNPVSFTKHNYQDLSIVSLSHPTTDVALIIDDSASMEEEQAVLLQELPGALRNLDADITFRVLPISPQLIGSGSVEAVKTFEWLDAEGRKQSSASAPTGVTNYDTHFEIRLNQNLQKISMASGMSHSAKEEAIQNVLNAVRGLGFNGAGQEAGLGTLGYLLKEFQNRVHGHILAPFILTDADDQSENPAELNSWPNNFGNTGMVTELSVDMIKRYAYRLTMTQSQQAVIRANVAGPILGIMEITKTLKPTNDCPASIVVTSGALFDYIRRLYRLDSPHLEYTCRVAPTTIARGWYNSTDLCDQPYGVFSSIIQYFEDLFGNSSVPGTCGYYSADSFGQNVRTSKLSKALSGVEDANYYDALAIGIKDMYGTNNMLGLLVRDPELESGLDCGNSEGTGTRYKAFADRMKLRGSSVSYGSVCDRAAYGKVIQNFTKELQKRFARTFIIESLAANTKLISVDYLDSNGTIHSNIAYTYDPESHVLMLPEDLLLSDQGTLRVWTLEEGLKSE